MSNLENIFLNQKLGVGFYIKRFFKSSNLKGFVMHLGSPLETVIKYLSSYKDLICVDLDNDYLEVLDQQKRQEIIDLKKNNKNAYNNLIRPIIRSYTNSLRKIYNDQVKYIILISSDGDLLRYCGVKNKYINVLMPENGIKTDMTNADNIKSREDANRAYHKKYEYRTDNELITLINFLLEREKIISL